ncbi:MAG TPA: hypothetical protein VJP79_11730 [Nitrososphaera sp.]|nr:hypothetical protein [Nitrososphaera sp.]
MVKTDWKSSDFEGRALRRQIKRALRLAEDYESNPQVHTQYLRAFAYLVSVKVQLAKFEVEKSIEERIERLEQLAHIAAKDGPRE